MRFLPILSAAGFASCVALSCRGVVAKHVPVLALGYTSAILGVTFLVGMSALLRRAVRSEQGASALDIARVMLAERWRMDRGLTIWQPLLAFVVVMTAFSIFKQTVLPTVGFAMGPAIADADRAIFGMDAWRLTHRLFSSPWASQMIDLSYHAWFLPMTLGVVLCAAAKPGSVLAQRYLLSYVLSWIVQGSLLAYLMPAAGPIYFSEFQAEAGRFLELSARLAEQDAWLRAVGAPGLSALTGQEYLLLLFRTGTIGVGGGISAMPSLHNALAVLFACAAWHFSVRWGWFAIAYAVLTWIGSIHLGWHYALDGVVALAATMAIWKATGFIYGTRTIVREPRSTVPA